MSRTVWHSSGWARAMRGMRRSRAVSGFVAAVLIVPLLGSAAQATAATRYPTPSVNLGPSGSDPGAAPVRTVKLPNPTAKSFTPSAVSWPGAASVSTALAAPAQAASAAARSRTATGALGPAARAAGTPLTLRAVADKQGAYQGPASVNVRVLDHAESAKTGVNGVVFTATPEGAGRGSAQVSLDYSSFAQAYGGNYASRLHLVELPACALTTPQLAACRTQTPLASSNDTAAHSVTAQVVLGRNASSTPKASAQTAQTSSAASMLVVAATSAPSSGDGGSPAGQYGATSLKPAGSWSAGGSTGSFDYSYPISVPPAASPLVPTVALSYDSGSVDGQTAATQAQADWLGDGWSTPENYVEQSFVPCSDSPEGVASAQSTSDQCYDGNILTISLNGSSTSLVRDDTSGTWKLATDNGSTVSMVTGGSNDPAIHNDEYWKVTERDGTSYYFGLNELPGWSSGQPTTSSVQSEPVYSAHDPSDTGHTYTDPCYNATWSSSWCTMAYRWNLDYVTDVHGNAMAYYYKQDTNAYAQNNATSKATAYVRDAHVDHIDYGFTDGNAYGTIPDKVQFSTGDRCLAGASACDPIASNTANWPDVPADLICTAGASCTTTGPSYFSTVRLTGITSEQYNGSGYSTVDSYSFTQTLPPPGDDTAATLWLSSISHTGSDTSAGGTAPPAQVESFAGVQEQNRVDTATDGLPKLVRWRIASITTETGAVISVNYELVNACTAPVTISPATNTSSCYPVYWTPSGAGSPLLDWFNKYVVKSVDTSDPTGGSPGLATSYKYAPNGGGAAWHFDDSEVVQSKYRTYGQYRGYEDVQTFTGQGSDPLTESESTFYRGMSDDNNSTAVTLTDSQTGTHDDTNQLAGDTLESTQYAYSGGPVVSSAINSYWVSGATASRARTGLPALTANATGQVETWNRQAITDQSPTTWRTSETDTSYDATATDANFGLPVITYAHGDLSVSGNSQKRCTVTTYTAANSSKNLVGLPVEVEEDALACGGSSPNGASAPTSAEINALTAPSSVNRPADVVSDKRTFYDLQAPGSTTRPSTTPTWPEAAPTYGDESETQQADGYTGGAFTYQVKNETTYDTYGRTLDVWDALGNETQTAYTMTNGVTTAQSTTNALGQKSTSVIDPERDIPISVTDANGVVTQTHLDGLGRAIAIWTDSRPTTAPANQTYTYAVSSTAPTVITTQTLNNMSGYATSEQFYDALLRPRQTQTPTPQGGRLLTDVFYDSHGWTVKLDTNYRDSSSTPDTTMAPVVGDNKEYQQTLTSYDGLGRAVKVQSLDNTANPVVDQISYTAYTGDKTIAVPPTGGVAQATVTDALGRTSELDQYTSRPTVTTGTAGGFTTTSITGGATQATDYLYNTVGQQTDVKDVATGEDWNTTYNLLGQVTGKNDPDAGPSSLQYDANGNVIQSTDARAKTISYTYDALNRKTGQYDAPYTSHAASNQLASWAYDNSNGLVNGMTDPIGHLTTEDLYTSSGTYAVQQNGFNAFGESTGETITVPSGLGAFSSTDSFTYTNAYNAVTGKPTSTTYPAAGALSSEQVKTNYSTVNELDLVNTLGSPVASYLANITYTAFGQIGQEELGGSGTGGYNADVTNTYNFHTGALTDQQIANTAVSATPIDDTAYTYDQAGNPTSQTETRQGTSSETQCFQYDGLDRLSQAWTATDKCAATPTSTNYSTVGDGIAGGQYWSSWTYDSQGQWKTQTQHSLASGTADTVTSYTYGGSASSCTTSSTGANTLASTSTTGPSGTTGNTYCYDASGNSTQRNTTANGQQSLTWNDLGQLSAVTTASAGSSYIYDPEGNLLVQNDASTNTSTLYLPDQQIALNTGNGTTSATRFYPLPGGGQAVRTGTGSSYVFELGDAHGTSLLELDATFTTPTWRQMTPYGAPRGTTVAWPDNHGFLNKPQDTTTGLTDVGARWYDPTLGRFESLDPAFEPASPQQLNGYTYAADNPITGSDPTGLRDCVDECGGSADVYLNNYARQQRNSAASKAAAAAAAAAQQAQNQLSSDQAQQQKLDEEIAALKAYIAEQKRLAALNEADAPGGDILKSTDGCTQMKAKWGACAGDEASIADGCAQMGAQCLIAQLTAALPIGDMLGWLSDAVGFTKFAANVGSKALDAIPGLSNVLDATVGTANKLLDSLTSQASKLANKILGDEADVSATKAAATGCNSFAGSTLVLMADGTSKPIGKIKVGDKIANNQPGTDPGTKNQTHIVTAVHITYTDTDFTNVTIATKSGPATIVGTAHHPYWDATTQAWTDATRLHPGDRVETTNADLATVLATNDYTSHTIVTYNLTVDGLHTYYVLAGDTPVLVHNAGGAANCLIGQQGEAASGITKNTQTIIINGRARIPDEFDPAAGIIGEVKNVKYQYLSTQLKDDLSYAQTNGWQFNLYVNSSTRLSGPLQDLVDSGDINLIRNIP
jgi:RHS repeat-associated protein